MTLNLTLPVANHVDFHPRIAVIGVGGGGTNAVNNMIAMGLSGVEFIVANTDAQSLMHSPAERRVQLGPHLTQGLGAGAKPEIGRAAAEEATDEIARHIEGCHMVFITAGMGGGTGTGAAPVIARMARERNMLTVGVVTKPFEFEGVKRRRIAEQGIEELQQFVDTLIVIPNQNLFRVANERTTLPEAFRMVDNILYMGVKGVTDLMVKPGMVNLDFADIRTVMAEMGKATMGTGQAEGEDRAIRAAEAAISNPLLEDTSMRGARGVLISLTGGRDMTLFEVEAAVSRIRKEVDEEANIIFGTAVDDSLNGTICVSVVATGIDIAAARAAAPEGPSLKLVTPESAPRANLAGLAPAASAPAGTAQPRQRVLQGGLPGGLRPAANMATVQGTLAVQAEAPPQAEASLQTAPHPAVVVAPPAGAMATPPAEAAPRRPMAPQDVPAGGTLGSMFKKVTGLVTGRAGAAPPRPEMPAAPRAVRTPAQDELEIPAFLRRQSNH
ncbi:MAG: cell division protein FtsZ [Rhodovarius sp.]|nr:cell division protein FtsZ [Rhodovarius sp.]